MNAPRRLGEHKPVRGTFSGSNFPRVAISFDHDDFERINSLAAANDITFSEQVRRLVRDGLKTSVRNRACVPTNPDRQEATRGKQ